METLSASTVLTGGDSSMSRWPAVFVVQLSMKAELVLDLPTGALTHVMALLFGLRRAQLAGTNCAPSNPSITLGTVTGTAKLRVMVSLAGVPSGPGDAVIGSVTNNLIVLFPAGGLRFGKLTVVV